LTKGALPVPIEPSGLELPRRSQRLTMINAREPSLRTLDASNPRSSA